MRASRMQAKREGGEIGGFGVREREGESELEEKRKDVPALTLFELFEYLPFCLKSGLYLLLPCL